MTIEDSIKRWDFYFNLFQKLVDTFEDDVENDNVFSALEAVFICNLHSILVSAMHISQHALNLTQDIQQGIQKEVETEHE